jgi:tripartite-type tricarboxylate transporter receptor subunit TctC
MKLPRRRFLQLAASAAVFPAVSRTAGAQTYPARTVRIVVGYPAGGVSDIYARLIGQWLSERMGQTFLIENRPGAAGTIGVESVARAPGDGYTLLLTSANDAYNEFIYSDVKFNYLRDIAPVANIAVSTCIMVVNPSVPARSVPEFVAYARANSGKVNFASAGIGSAQHLIGELFKMVTGTNMVHVPYRGGAPAVSDLLAGQVQVMFEFMATSIEHVRSGGLRALGVTTAVRSRALPDVPTLAEFLPGFEATSWLGMAAPKQTPPEIVDRLNREINAALADPKMRARIAELGAEPAPGSPAEFVKVIAADTEKWGKVIRASGIRAG